MFNDAMTKECPMANARVQAYDHSSRVYLVTDCRTLVIRHSLGIEHCVIGHSIP